MRQTSVEHKALLIVTILFPRFSLEVGYILSSYEQYNLGFPWSINPTKLHELYLVTLT